MNWIKTVVGAAALGLLAACGGGGDAGASKFSNGTDSTTAASPATNGVANQGKLSIALEKWALDWADQDDETAITVTVANTVGSPSPAGTVVRFSAEAGFLDSETCVLEGKTASGSSFAQCSVKFKPGSASSMPTDGYATVLVYMEGEEAYIDVDSSRSYTAGDYYHETGTIFRDDDNDGVWSPLSAGLGGIDTFSLSGKGSGSSVCRQDAGVINNLNLYPASIDGTCDGKWGATYISSQVYIPMSYKSSVGVEAVGVVRAGVYAVRSYSTAPGGVKVAPYTDTTVTVTTTSGSCTLGAVSDSPTPSNAIGPVLHEFTFDTATCSGASVQAEADSDGSLSTTTFSIP